MEQGLRRRLWSAVFIVGTGVVVHRRHAAREADEILSQA